MALSDGIFGFAMTLLVVDLALPDPTSPTDTDELLRALLSIEPKFESYVISFLVLGIFWFVQHQTFKYVRRTDARFAWLTILYLMFIVLMPLTTAILGSYHDNQVAVSLYAGTLLTAELIVWIRWQYASRGHRLVQPDLARRLIAYNSQVGLLTMGVFLLSIGVAFWSPSAAMWTWLLTAAIHPALDRLYHVDSNQ